MDLTNEWRMNKPSVKVSVIVPVLNEERYISSLMESLLLQSYPRNEMEWIFVDGGSGDNTVSVIERFKSECPIRVLKTQRGTPHQLNVGIRESTGKYVIRLDAHTYYPDNYIEKCVLYLDNCDADNVGGRVNTVGTGLIGQAIAKVLSSKFGVGGSQFRVGGESGYVDTVPFGAFRREVFDRIGLFNEELIRSEDNDINARIRQAGGKVYLAEDIESDYHCRDTVSAIIKYAMQNGNALFHTIKVNPKAMSIRHFIPFLFVVSLILLPILGIKFTFLRYMFFMEIVLYLLMDIYFSFFSKGRQYGFVTVLLFPLFHISYGIGSAISFIGIKLY